MILMFDKQYIDDAEAFSFFNDFVSFLKSTMEDNYDYELRCLSVKLFFRILASTQNLVVEQELHDSYQMLLKRLDDSQNTIRIETCKTLIVFFNIVNARVKISETIFEFIVKTLFIHFDDQNESIRNIVKDVLRVSMNRYPQKFYEIAQENLKRFNHQNDCLEVIKEADNLMMK
jgi:hypothetical protein